MKSLDQVCKAHDIKMMTPLVYVNEMAGHGRKALELLEIYPELPDEAKWALRGSRNAYLSHFSYISSTVDITLKDFLEHFGLIPGASIRKIENRLLTILESHGVSTGFTGWHEQGIRDEIQNLKPTDLKLLVDHDAATATNLISNNKNGYILATWDNVMIDVVQDLARVYAENPARINDFLSAIGAVSITSNQSEDLLFTLLHVDEHASEQLAKKLDDLSSVDSAYKLKRFVDEARKRKSDGIVEDREMIQFLQRMEV